MNIANWSMDIAPRCEKDKRYFSVEQANKSLVLLQRIVGEVVREYKTLMELEELIESAEQANCGDQLERARQELVSTVDNLQGCLEELDQIGVELRDFSRGIVDFPSMQDSRSVSLCWLLGEAEVSHWHERGAGFACRQHVTLLNSPEYAAGIT